MVDSCSYEVLACVVMALLFVGSLYIWDATHGRDHPSTIKKRCFSSIVMIFLSSLFVWSFSDDLLIKNVSLFDIMGLRKEGIFLACFLPFLLTVVLFFGPILQNHFSAPLQLMLRVYFQPQYWHNISRNPVWWRNQIVAPFSEEFTFRVCMLPLLTRCFSSSSAIFIAPLFFGIGFQFFYTSVFGFYSSFLFLRTGHFLPLFIVHAFCNHMGFPEIKELLSKQEPLRTKLIIAHIFGIVMWYILLFPVTEPSLYNNKLYKL